MANDDLMEEVVYYATNEEEVFTFLYCEIPSPEFRVMLVELYRLMVEDLVCDKMTLGYYGNDAIRLEWYFGRFYLEEVGEFGCGYNLGARN